MQKVTRLRDLKQGLKSAASYNCFTYAPLGVMLNLPRWRDLMPNFDRQVSEELTNMPHP